MMHLVRISPLVRLSRPRATTVLNTASHFHTSPKCAVMDSRYRTSNFCIPTTNTQKSTEDVHDLLLRGGFIHQTHPGIFHMLPLGLRVQEKIQNIINTEMRSLGGTQLSLSSISTQKLWEKSGRYASSEAELFKFTDRKKKETYILGPTHEEEITTLVGSMVTTYRDLPLRLYQISRKYRDERRPRGGLLRGREFIMKDLYTFDSSHEAAMETYEEVRRAYIRIFDQLGMRYYIAAADSGNIGGDLSHEFHVASPTGEDTVIHCPECGYTANQEVFTGTAVSEEELVIVDGIQTHEEVAVTSMISTDKKSVCKIHYLKGRILNIPAVVKAAEMQLRIKLDAAFDEKSVISLVSKYPEMLTVNLIDHRVCSLLDIPPHQQKLDLCKLISGDNCPSCHAAAVDVLTTIELGHTFHLGTKYSKPLNATFMARDNSGGTKTAIEMGCHGIGVTRLIAAIGDTLKDEKGLIWPVKLAPFECIILTKPIGKTKEVDTEKVGTKAEDIYDELQAAGIEAIIDDSDKPMGAKLDSAEKAGYPVYVFIDREGVAQIRSRRPGENEVYFVENSPSSLVDTVKTAMNVAITEKATSLDDKY